MTPDELEEIKKSYIFKNAVDVTQKIDTPTQTVNKENIINLLDQYIKQSYPQYWNKYMEGKMYGKSNSTIDNLPNIINKYVSGICKEMFLQNHEIDKQTKQLITNLLDNQTDATFKLNKIYNNLQIDYNPILIYLLSLVIHRL